MGFSVDKLWKMNKDRYHLTLFTIRIGIEQTSLLFLTQDTHKELIDRVDWNYDTDLALGQWNGKIETSMSLMGFDSSKLLLDDVEIIWDYTPKSIRELSKSNLHITRKTTKQPYTLQLTPEVKQVFSLRSSHPTWSIQEIAKEVDLSFEEVKTILINESAYLEADKENLMLLTFRIGGYKRSYALLTKLQKEQVLEILDNSIDMMEEQGFDGTVFTHTILLNPLKEHVKILNPAIEAIWDYDEFRERQKQIQLMLKNQTWWQKVGNKIRGAWEVWFYHG